MAQLEFFLPPMPPWEIKLTSVQLHLFLGTSIQDALPTELLRQIATDIEIGLPLPQNVTIKFMKKVAKASRDLNP